MTILEAIQYIRDKITQTFTAAQQPAENAQAINNVMTSFATLAVDISVTVEHLKATVPALTANTDVIRAANAVSNALGEMGIDAQVVYDAARNDPAVIMSGMNALPAIMMLRNAEQLGISQDALFPIFLTIIQPVLNAGLNATDRTPSGVKMRAAVNAVIERASTDMNVRNSLITTFTAIKDMLTHSFNTRAVDANETAQSSQAFNHSLVAIADLVESSAQAAVQAHGAAILHSANRRPASTVASNDNFSERPKRRRK